jgi:rSAM/selenodomain-associated transferase 1
VQPVIIVFAKAPVPGKVKTRLTPLLGPERCLDLHRAMVAATVRTAKRISGIEVELHTDAPCDDWPDAHVVRRLQTAGGLQLKLLHALSTALETHDRALVLGSDSPTLPASHVAQLLAATADVALGPAEDGGFWGIAASRTHPAMFDGVEWSSPTTLEQTAAAVRRAGLSIHIGPTWYDVDDPASLERLLQERPNMLPLD